MRFLINQQRQDEIDKADNGKKSRYGPLRRLRALAHRRGQITSRPPPSFTTSYPSILCHLLKSPSAEIQYSLWVSNWFLMVFDDDVQRGLLALELKLKHVEQSCQCHRKCWDVVLNMYNNESNSADKHAHDMTAETEDVIRNDLTH